MILGVAVSPRMQSGGSLSGLDSKLVLYSPFLHLGGPGRLCRLVLKVRHQNHPSFLYPA